MGTFAKAVVLLLPVALLAMTTTFGVANSQSANGDHDTDGDGLIEIQYLEQLDAIRYDLNGDGKADANAGIAPYASAFPGTVCNSSCNGYELIRSLDFDDADSYASGAVTTAWTTGEGWEPIQAGALWGIVAEYLFDATFDGNGHTISNLYVSRPHSGEGAGPVGLFGSTSDSVIRNVGLIDVSTDGFTVVGGLVGINHGFVSDSYVTGSVSGVAALGGLVGWNAGEITGSRFFRHRNSPDAGDLETECSRWTGRRAGRRRDHRRILLRQRLGPRICRWAGRRGRGRRLRSRQPLFRSRNRQRGRGRTGRG